MLPGMNDVVKQDRSPRAPIISLANAIDLVKKLHSHIGRSKVDVGTAGNALGYSGTTGSTLTVLASLSQYQLIDREQGKVFISPLAFRISHPTSPGQSKKSLQEAALAPKVFKELFENFRDASEEVIASHLVQNRFGPNRARQVARAFKSNISYFPEDAAGILPINDEGKSAGDLEEAPPRQPTAAVSAGIKMEANPTVLRADALLPSANVLARYSIPLGENEANLVFTGSRGLTPEDFTALIEYVELFKKQFERRQPKPENPEPVSGS
jgi:hypothetical protein